MIRSRLLACGLASVLLAGCEVAPAAEAPHGVTFGVIGDMPYLPGEDAVLQDIILRMDKQPLAFVVHVGDFKSGAGLCTDAVFETNRARFDASLHPFVYVPGDNDWTDCHRLLAGGYDPVERLNKLRALFFATGRSLGRTRMPVERQSEFDRRHPGYAENLRWSRDGVQFVTLNVQGSNNNFGRTAEMDREYQDRNAADLDWMAEAFARARSDRAVAVVLFMQADPLFELPEGNRRRRGYDSFLAALRREVIGFGGPVLLVHGDTHVFRFDQPVPGLANLWRLESYGSPVLGWVRVTVTAPASPPFTAMPHRYPE